MNIYMEYLTKNFGGAHLKGFHVICDLLSNYDINNLNKAYHDYEKDHNISYASVERAVRHYIQIISSKQNIEKVLNTKCFNGVGFTNKEFLMTVKLKAEEATYETK